MGLPYPPSKDIHRQEPGSGPQEQARSANIYSLYTLVRSTLVLTVFAGRQPPRDGDGDVQLPAFRQRQKCELLNGPDTFLHLVA